MSANYLHVIKNRKLFSIFLRRLRMKIFGKDRIQNVRICQINKQLKVFELQSIISKEIYTELLNSKCLPWICNMYIDHRFDLLGSGWVDVGYDARALGVMGFTYNKQQVLFNYDNTEWIDEILIDNDSKKAKEIFSRIDLDYIPINWQRDLRCGYCWSAKKTISQNEIMENLKGVDVKTCWELGRMHHLVQLSEFASSNKASREKCIREFRNQMLDFMAMNPIGKGIQWACPMDVAIRACNILVAYDLFVQLDTNSILDSEFQKCFSRNIYAHGLYIWDNLEIDILTNIRNNHYLSNLVGLLYISAYLNRQGKARKWWKYACKEFFTEVDSQFFPDGANFEGSTAYHRLSGELLVFGAAIINRLEKNVPSYVVEKIIKSGKFSQAIGKSNGSVFQLGDNDSGRLFKFSPQGEFLSPKQAEKKYVNLEGYCKQYSDIEYFDEYFLNHDSFVSAISGFVEYPQFEREKMTYPLEASAVQSIKGDHPVHENDIPKMRKVEACKAKKNFLKGDFRTKTTFLSDNISTIQGAWTCFPDFGIYCYKSKTVEIFLNVGRRKAKTYAHTHDDTLHVEICILGKDIFPDPGTYVYTALPEKRDEFRSYKAHYVPDYGVNPSDVISVFSIRNKVKSWVNHVSDNYIESVEMFDDIIHHRTIEVFEREIVISDFGNKKYKINNAPFKYFSNGYGKIINNDTTHISIDSHSNFDE